MRFSEFLFAIATVASVVLLTGCKSQLSNGELKVQVVGRVSIDGNPVGNARIVFIPFRLKGPTDRKQQMAFAMTDAEGNFTLARADGEPGVCPGLHQVMISKRKTIQKPKPNDPPKKTDFLSLTTGDSELRQPDDELIPVIYNRYSTLTFSVEPASKQVRADFELSSVDPLLKKRH